MSARNPSVINSSLFRYLPYTGLVLFVIFLLSYRYDSHTQAIRHTVNNLHSSLFSSSSSAPAPLPGLDLSYTPGNLNSTLDFGAIYVLATDFDTWRTQGLRQVANRLGIELQIPELESPTEEVTHSRFNGANDARKSGTIRCMLNHMALLKKFLESDAETALILEDDTDFDINIFAQLEALQEALQPRIDEATGSSEQSISTRTPWDSSNWDLLWLGHCGVENVEHITTSEDWNMPHALSFDRLSSGFNEYYNQARDRNAKPHILRNGVGMCTFGYAITRSGAQTIFDGVLKSGYSIDLYMHRQCKRMDGPGLSCVVPVPELFHHHQVDGESRIGINGATTGQNETEDLEWARTRHQYTYNVESSARCNVGQVGEKLGDRWQCLPGRYDDKVI